MKQMYIFEVRVINEKERNGPHAYLDNKIILK